MGLDMVGKVNGTSCALIPPSIRAKVENGSCGSAGGALGTGGLPPIRVHALELVALELFGNTPSITPFPFMSLLGSKEVVTLGANWGIGNPCQVSSCTSCSFIGSYSMANLSKNMGVKMMVCVTLRYTYNTFFLTIE